MMYWIKDQDDSPQRFPLKLLFMVIIKLLKPTAIELRILRSRGYGARICEWDDLLDEQDSIAVNEETLAHLLEGVDEWFYDLDVEVKAKDLIVRFGLHDSTAMYLDAPEEIANLVIDKFENVQKARSMKGHG